MEWVGPMKDISEEGWGNLRFKRPSIDAGHLPAIQSAPGSIAEDDEDGHDEAIFEEEDFEDLPLHHQQLYKLYGKDADYFLHPKTEEELDQEKVVQDNKFAHLFRSQGAQELWHALRGQSIEKLALQNKSVRPHLKVENVDRLMDDSKIKLAQDRQQKVNIMYKTSQINQDKFTVLNYNNPLHHLARPEVPESVSVYMPSWAKRNNSVADTIRSSSDKEWQTNGVRSQETDSLGNRKQRRDDRRSPREHIGAQDEVGGDVGVAAGGDAGPQLRKPSADEWSFIRESVRPRSTKRQHVQQARYVFLTEEAAWEPGQFTKRRQEAQDATKPQAYDEKMESGLEATKQPKAYDEKPTLQSNALSPVGSRRSSARRRLVQWQPLSMNALAGNNKSQIEAPGEGGFSHGKTAVWTVAS